jgi:exonuclease III
MVFFMTESSITADFYPNRQILLPTTMTQDSLPIEPNLRICNLNIEGISASKSEYLARLMRDNEINIIALQETHSTSDTNLMNRGDIPGYKLIGVIHSNGHGMATYARVSLNNCYSDCSNNIHVLAVEVSGISIVNVYKPSNANWLNNTLEKLSHPAIYLGDFNSHNQAWGYDN